MFRIKRALSYNYDKMILDLLLEKTPFRLTDKTIPGFWGHVGLWIGDQQDLEELGIVEQMPKLEGKRMTIFISPKTQGKKK